MKRIVAALLGVILLAACGGGRPQADQDRDGRLVASALRAAWTEGASFTFSQDLDVAGGDMAGGQPLHVHSVTESGVLLGSASRFSIRLEQAQGAVGYAMVVVDGRLYVKRQDSSAWKTVPLATATTLLTALRLDLVRETVLLASSVSSGSLGHLSSGFARKYTVQPAPDQLEELQGVAVQGAAEDQFLKTATGELDVYLTFPGDKLTRVEVHLHGVDASNGEQLDIHSALDVRPMKVRAIEAPADAQQVEPSTILT